MWRRHHCPVATTSYTLERALALSFTLPQFKYQEFKCQSFYHWKRRWVSFKGFSTFLSKLGVNTGNMHIFDFISPSSINGKPVVPWTHNACASTWIAFITFFLPLPSSFWGLYIYDILPSATKKHYEEEPSHWNLLRRLTIKYTKTYSLSGRGRDGVTKQGGVSKLTWIEKIKWWVYS